MHMEPLFSEESLPLTSTMLRAVMKPSRIALDTHWNGFLIPDSRLWQINEAWLILETFTMKHKPNHIFLLFSGGYDSLIAAHLSIQLLNDTFRKYASHFGDHVPQAHVLHVNTGIGIPETREFVRTVATGHRWHYLEYTTPQNYEQLCLTYGFPGPGQHTTMYSRLKERALRMAVRDHTPAHPFEIHHQEIYDILNDMQQQPLLHQYVLIRVLKKYLTQAITQYRQEELRPILFVTGVRKQESARRMGTVQAAQKQGRHWWLSPLISWSKDDILEYRDANQLPHNMVVDLIHKSGECLCGAFAKAGELEELCVWFPQIGAYIKDLERRVRAAGFHWGWEGAPPRKKKHSEGQIVLPGFDLPETKEEKQMPFSPLCSSCNAQHERDHLTQSCSFSRE